MRQKAGQIVRKTAFDVQADYQQNCRVESGAQKNSAYVATANTSTYPQAVAAAQAVSPGVELLPEVPRPDPYTAVVAVGVSYATLNEYGGHGHSGDGAMTQAAASNRAPFRAAMGKLLEP
jgi:hypothetical protein